MDRPLGFNNLPGANNSPFMAAKGGMPGGGALQNPMSQPQMPVSRLPQYPEGMEPPEGAPLGAPSNYNPNPQGPAQAQAQQLGLNQQQINPLLLQLLQQYMQPQGNPFVQGRGQNPMMGGGAPMNPLMGMTNPPPPYG